MLTEDEHEPLAAPALSAGKLGDLRHAGLVGKAELGHEAVHIDNIPAITTMSHALVMPTVEHTLAGQHHVRPAPLLLDLEPVVYGRQGPMCPAGTAVDGDMLVPRRGAPVLTILVAPVKRNT